MEPGQSVEAGAPKLRDRPEGVRADGAGRADQDQERGDLDFWRWSRRVV
jgi:hypothetical protein